MATSLHPTSSAKTRARLRHPVVDADGHMRELSPLLFEYVRGVGGSRMVKRLMEAFQALPAARSHQMTSAERHDTWTPMAPWWGAPTNAADQAAVMTPRLLGQRLDDFGIDFMVVYPSQGMFLPHFPDEELRRAGCRAFNTFIADYYREHADRMTPVAVIPMHTPQEAVEELDHAVRVLGLKAVTCHGSVARLIPSVQQEHPEAAHLVTRSELFALDSDYDYDAVWRKCVELKVACTFHIGIGLDAAPSGNLPGKSSISSYVYNHLGSLSQKHYWLCKALFLGGVTNRFPGLTFAFLEGGVGWACNLYADLVGHWTKRGGKAIEHLDPARLDHGELLHLIQQHGGDKVQAKMAEIAKALGRDAWRPEVLDEFAACGIERAEDIRDLFVGPFYFGCEADDPITASAFNRKVNPFGASLHAIFGSDIGHWDVPVMSDVVAEAYEQVERGSVTEEEFRSLTFVNPVTLHTRMNPSFFKGTRLESAVGRLLQGRKEELP